MSSTTYTNKTISDYAGKVLSVTPAMTNPHWDSGWSPERYYICKVWDKDLRAVLTLDVYRPRDQQVYSEDFAPPVTDDPETVNKASFFEAVLNWLVESRRQISARKYSARKLSKGDVVEVFKGRKVPRGKYVVVSDGEQKGNYGPYVDLAATDAPLLTERRFRYVSVDNCKKPEPTFEDLGPYASFLLQIESIRSSGSGYIEDTLDVLADAMNDRDDPREQTVRDISKACRLGAIGVHSTF